jgi:8-oxo-dGTP pyrophosphatase MutT (NUDIX family)
MGAETEMLEKAKVAIVNGQGEILVLTRSELEDSRPGEPDWAGGKFDSEETSPQAVMLREVGEEMPGTKLDNIMPLHVYSKIKAGKFAISYFFAATAKFPTDGVVLSHEHSDAAWVPRDEFQDLNIPSKYKAAVALGESVLDRVAALAPAEEPLHLAA